MRSKCNFVLWKLEILNGRKCKIPYSANYNGRASSTNPRTWCSYKKALEALKTGQYDGIGYVFDKGITFIDLDNSIMPDGTLTELAQNVIDAFPDAFIEISQSGTGLHIFIWGEVPTAVKTKEIEMYSTGRYVALTMNAIQPLELVEAQKRIDTLYRWLNRNKPPEGKERLPQCVNSSLNLSEREIIDKAAAGNNGQVFVDLLHGDWKAYGFGDGSQSSADLKFCNMLAFWTRCNQSMMQSIFRSSGMYRNDRKMNNAIRKAINDCGSVFGR